MPEYTDAQKLSEIRREIALRRRVYPSLIAAGKLGKSGAFHQIEMLRAIAADYENRLGLTKTGELFGETTK